MVTILTVKIPANRCAAVRRIFWKKLRSALQIKQRPQIELDTSSGC